MKRTLLVIIAVFLAGCASGPSGPRIDTGIGGAPTKLFGWNIGAADLLDPSTASSRLAIYLDELSAAGYAKQLRIIYTPSQGPFILRHWIPVIRTKGYTVAVILSQSHEDADLTQQKAWVREGLPPILDIMDAVQLANEPDRPAYNDKSPEQYATWHRKLLAVVREVAPGVAVLSPDFDTSEQGWVAQTKLVYGADYDIISLHVTHVDRVNKLKAFKERVEDFAGRKQPRVWITEGDWGQTDGLSREGLLVGRTYVYVWNGREPESRRPGGPLP